MVCVVCSWNSAAKDFIEICADNDFSRHLAFYSDNKARLESRVKWGEASGDILPKHTTCM